MGTGTAPTLRIAKSAIDHSDRFSEISATRSPAFMPRSLRPSAILRTRRTNSSAEMRTHSSPRFSLTASGLLWRAMASRHRAAKVLGEPVTHSCLLPTADFLLPFAAAFEETCKHILLPGLKGCAQQDRTG